MDKPSPSPSPSPSPQETQSSGTAGDGGSRTRRRRGGNRSRGRRPNNASTRYKGRIAELSDFIFDVDARSNDAFNTSLREISEYIARTINNGGEFMQALDPDKLEFADNDEPTPPTDATDVVKMEKWKLQMRRWEAIETKRTEATRQAYAVVIGQCSRALRDRMETHNEWASIKDSTDIIELAKLIRKAMYSGASSKHDTVTFIEAEQELMRFKQGKNMSNAKYLEVFKAKVEVYEHLGGEPGTSKGRVDSS